MKLTVMSFNTQHCLNYVEQRIDFDIMANAILACGADIVGLNEMRGDGPHPDYTPQTEALAARTGMPYYYFAPAISIPDQGLYGNALLSKIPILHAETVMIPDPVPRKHDSGYETRCVIRAELAGGIRVLVSHFGLNDDEQINAVQTVVEQIRDDKCILMGDFNVCPDSALLLPIRKRMTDAADAFSEERLSFPSDAPYCKIDYIFTSPDIGLKAADIPVIVASDHRPHTAVLEFDD